ncbi:MAG: polysaccharide deacetylase family protein [Alphaproteobacteria bacterium]|jgi:peptidoglycan/xylan/chitin deacetylase (PgdA/CDA1 family)|nr:polysaccharide deacetylase family protein [Alphaproteobacteria bacterium]MDP6564418.1 polysaccharide deacetylase family protein [Alphaproteobacteria bacterium]MDP6815631.1 polysaccharide deacetylase family protein [Alphaproteobacteria bacterium]
MNGAAFWPDGGRLALSLVVNVEEGAEYNIRDGDKGPEMVDELGVPLRRPMRNLSNESNYRYGLNRGAPRVLDLLAGKGVPATFTAAALALERAPDLARRIIADGHEVCAHGHRWVQQYGFDEAREREFIEQAAASIERTCGRRPMGWLSRYLCTENTRRLLIEAGYGYHMDDFSDDQPFWDSIDGRPMLILPYALDTNDMKLWSDPAYTPNDWLDYLIDTFEVLYDEGASEARMMSVGVHLRIIGRPGRIGLLEKFIDHAQARPGVWFATRAAIAEHWAVRNPFPGA